MNSLLYVFGCVMAVAVRACMWFDSQPQGAGFKMWWIKRRWSNLGSLLMGILGTWAWNDGSLVSLIPFGEEAKITVTLGLSPIAGFLVTIGARHYMSKLLAKMGADGPDKP